MNKEQLINYQLKHPNFFYTNFKFFGFIFFILFIFVSSTINEINNLTAITVFISFLIFILLVIFIYFKINNAKQVKERKFYNTIISVAQQILKDENQLRNHKIIINSASIIIKYKLLKHDKNYWTVDSPKELDEPFAISLGEKMVNNIAIIADENNINNSANEYPDFDRNGYEKAKEKALLFEETIKRNSDNRFNLAEKKAKSRGIDVFDFLDEEENLRNTEKQKQDKEDEVKTQKRLENRVQFALGICPYCFRKVARLARKCPHCTADL